MFGAMPSSSMCLVALAACSAAPLDLDQLDAAVLAARCARAARCGLVRSIEACEAASFTPPPNSFQAARDAGHLEFDGEQARRCQDVLSAQSCDLTSREFRVTPEACRRMFRGRIADGDACAFDEECASGRCDQGVCPEGVCCIGLCGETRVGGHPGDACGRSSECIDGYCDADHSCHALAAENAACLRDEQCEFGLACVSPSPSIPGECRPLPHLGEPCPYQRCAEANAICDATGRCAAVGLAGAPCTSHTECSPFIECDLSSQRCIELPTLGMPCDTDCAGDSYCRFTTDGIGVCTELMVNGTPCDDPGTCASHNCKPGPVFDSCEDYPICP